MLYQISSSYCSEFGTGPSKCRSSLDLDKIFRRDTISPLLGPQLKDKKQYILLFYFDQQTLVAIIILKVEIMSNELQYKDTFKKCNSKNGVKTKVISYCTR